MFSQALPIEESKLHITKKFRQQIMSCSKPKNLISSIFPLSSKWDTNCRGCLLFWQGCRLDVGVRKTFNIFWKIRCTVNATEFNVENYRNSFWTFGKNNHFFSKKWLLRFGFGYKFIKFVVIKAFKHEISFSDNHYKKCVHLRECLSRHLLMFIY